MKGQEMMTDQEMMVKYYTDLLEAVGLSAKVVVRDDMSIFLNDVYMGSFKSNYAVHECLASIFRAITDPVLIQAVNLETETAKAALYNFYGEPE